MRSIVLVGMLSLSLAMLSGCSRETKSTQDRSGIEPAKPAANLGVPGRQGADTAEAIDDAPDVGQAQVQDQPSHVGDCRTTRISEIGGRLEGDPDSGFSISYSNGLFQTSYDVLPAVTTSRVGDSVQICLTELPHDCPPGDDRGKVYSVENLRTKQQWVAADSQHICGGA